VTLFRNLLFSLTRGKALDNSYRMNQKTKLITMWIFTLAFGCSSDEVATSTSQTTTTTSTQSTSSTGTTTSTSTPTTSTPTTSTTSEPVTAGITRAAERFLDSLAVDQKDLASFDLDDLETRQEWSNLPATIYPRTGLTTGAMTKEQWLFMIDLLQVSQSVEGYRKVEEIMLVEELLLQVNGDMNAGWDRYYISFFGTPSLTEPWAWQFDGHHLVLNFTVSPAELGFSPALWGISPNTIPNWGSDLDGETILVEERTTPRELLSSLTPEQRSLAVMSAQRMNTLLYGPGGDDTETVPEGINAKQLDADQQALLLEVVSVFINNAPAPFSEWRMFEIEDEIDELYFSWKGPPNIAEAAYYLVQGPSIIIEMDESENGEHLHVVYRDPTNDYGADILGAHKSQFH
jgi:hypothetical protein